jgi:hypothetical protein
VRGEVAWAAHVVPAVTTIRGAAQDTEQRQSLSCLTTGHCQLPIRGRDHLTCGALHLCPQRLPEIPWKPNLRRVQKIIINLLGLAPAGYLAAPDNGA